MRKLARYVFFFPLEWKLETHHTQSKRLGQSRYTMEAMITSLRRDNYRKIPRRYKILDQIVLNQRVYIEMGSKFASIVRKQTSQVASWHTKSQESGCTRPCH